MLRRATWVDVLGDLSRDGSGDVEDEAFMWPVDVVLVRRERASCGEGRRIGMVSFGSDILDLMLRQSELQCRELMCEPERRRCRIPRNVCLVKVSSRGVDVRILI